MITMDGSLTISLPDIMHHCTGVRKKIMKVIQDGTSTFGILLVSTWILESPKKRLLWVFLFMVVDLSSTTQKKMAYTVVPMLAFLRDHTLGKRVFGDTKRLCKLGIMKLLSTCLVQNPMVGLM